MMTLTWLLVLSVIFVAIMFFTRKEPPLLVDFRAIELPSTPNFYIACPENYCNITPNVVSPKFDMPVAQLKEKWLEMIASQPRITLLASNEANQFTYQQRTPILGFPDIINVKLISLGDGHATLAIMSQSKYGYSDLGVNQQRVTKWLNSLAKHTDR